MAPILKISVLLIQTIIYVFIFTSSVFCSDFLSAVTQTCKNLVVQGGTAGLKYT